MSTSRSSRSENEPRWMIYKRNGKWDDVVEGPDTDGVEVVPAAALSSTLRMLDGLQRTNDKNVQDALRVHQAGGAAIGGAIEAIKQAEAYKARLEAAEGERDRLREDQANLLTVIADWQTQADRYREALRRICEDQDAIGYARQIARAALSTGDRQ